VDKLDGEHVSDIFHAVMGLGDGVYNPWDNYDGVDNCRFRFNGRGRTTYKLSGFANGGGDNPAMDHTWIDLFNMTDNAAVAGSEAFLDKNSYGISGAFTLVDGEKEYRVRQKSGVQNNGGTPVNIKLTI
jgi:hypothetical protein